MHDLLFQKVFLVEEEDDGGLLEPGVGDDGVEQMETLHHSVHFLKEGGEGGREGERGGREKVILLIPERM